jgi:hypothetical protein
MAAAGIITLLMMPAWGLGTLLRILLAACLLYVPLFWVGRSFSRGGVGGP